MHVVVSSLLVGFHHCIIYFVVVCYCFVCSFGSRVYIFLMVPCSFVFNALHSLDFCLSSCLFLCLTLDLSLVVTWLFLVLCLILSGL